MGSCKKILSTYYSGHFQGNYINQTNKVFSMKKLIEWNLHKKELLLEFFIGCFFKVFRNFFEFWLNVICCLFQFQQLRKSNCPTYGESWHSKIGKTTGSKIFILFLLLLSYRISLKRLELLLRTWRLNDRIHLERVSEGLVWKIKSIHWRSSWYWTVKQVSIKWVPIQQVKRSMDLTLKLNENKVHFNISHLYLQHWTPSLYRATLVSYRFVY